MEAIEAGAGHSSPAQLLTRQQRATILAYGRLGDQRLVAEELGVSVQTVKNHLTAAYRRLGVGSAPQAIYVLMGGDGAARQVPPSAERSSTGHSVEGRGLRRRVTALEDRLARAQAELTERRVADRQRQQTNRAPFGFAPQMVDGRIRVRDLEAWSTHFDRDATSHAEMRITARDWVDLLRYYIRPSGSPMVGGG